MKVLHPFLIDTSRRAQVDGEDCPFLSLLGLPNLPPLPKSAFVKEVVVFNQYSILEFRGSANLSSHRGVTFHDCFKSWLDSKIFNTKWHNRLVKEGYSTMSKDLYVLYRDDQESTLSLHSVSQIILTPITLAVHLSNGQLIEEVLHTAGNGMGIGPKVSWI